MTLNKYFTFTSIILIPSLLLLIGCGKETDTKNTSSSTSSSSSSTSSSSSGDSVYKGPLDKQFVSDANNAGHENAINALQKIDHQLALGSELIALGKFAIKYRNQLKEAIFRPLFSGVKSLSWDPTHDSVFFTSLHNTNYMLLSSNETSSGTTGKGLFVVGEQNGHRYGAMAHNMFIKHANTDLSQLLNNTLDWLMKNSNSTKSITVLTAHISSNADSWYFRHNEGIRSWLQTYYPDSHTINLANSCDYEQLSSCIDSYKPDLIIYGEIDRDGRGYPSVQASLEKAITAKIPILVSNFSRESSPLTRAFLKRVGIQAQGNYWSKHRIENLIIDESYLKEDVTMVPVSMLLDDLLADNFSTSVLESCSTNYMFCDSTSFNNKFKTGADWFRNTLAAFDIANADPFEMDQPFLQANLLLSDKYRMAIDYPITPDEHDAYQKALIADWVISYSRSSNLAQTDLGEHIVDTAKVLKGQNAQFSNPKTIANDTRTFSVKYTAQWTTTGWYALPGKPVTLTRKDEGGSTTSLVRIKLYYARPNTNRIYANRTYTKPMYITQDRIILENGESVSFSTPYGSPIYIYLEGDEGNIETTLTVNGAAYHPAILDFSDAVQKSRFSKLMNETEIPHVDLRTDSYELHLRKDRLTEAFDSSVEFSNIDDLLTAIQQVHINSVYTLAGLKIQGLTLNESLPENVLKICSNLFGQSACVDESIHQRTIIQHANFDQHAQCGAGCSGNPWDAGWSIHPAGWGENHELGHNLQVNRFNAAYTTNPEDWKSYESRATENSNNIFPFYVRWNYHYNHKKETTTIEDSHSSTKRFFSVFMSDVAGLVNDSGERIVVDEKCKVLGTGEDRYEVMWKGNAYVERNWYRMSFYIQMLLRSHGLNIRDGTKLNWGYHIATLLYQYQRLYGYWSKDEATWNKYKSTLGFDMFPYQGESVYGGGTVRNIPGNDFLLVALSYLTRYNWQSQFDMYGLHYSSAAKAQAQAHAELGKLPMGIYVYEKDMPPVNWSDGMRWLPLSTSDNTTVWPHDGSSPKYCKANLTIAREESSWNVFSNSNWSLALSVDNNTETLTWDLAAGDKDYFTIDQLGLISFSSQSADSPLDNNADNIYEVLVIAKTKSGSLGTAWFKINVLNENDTEKVKLILTLKSFPSSSNAMEPFLRKNGASTYNMFQQEGRSDEMIWYGWPYGEVTSSNSYSTYTSFVQDFFTGKLVKLNLRVQKRCNNNGLNPEGNELTSGHHPLEGGWNPCSGGKVFLTFNLLAEDNPNLVNGRHYLSTSEYKGVMGGPLSVIESGWHEGSPDPRLHHFNFDFTY